MLSKCANPNCAEQFRYLHQGKLFYLHPAPDLRQFVQESCEEPYESFWLCDACSHRFTLVWDGLHARIVELPPAASLQESANDEQPAEGLLTAKTRGAGE